MQASVAVARGLSSCGSQALEHRFNGCGTWALLLHSLWDLPNSGIEPGSPVLQAYTLPWEPPVLCYLYIYKYSREWTIQQEKEKRKKKKNIKLPLFAGD